MTGNGGDREMACIVVDGTLVAVTGDGRGEVRMHSLRTGQARGEPFTHAGGATTSIACTVADGVPIAISAHLGPGGARVWDLRTGRPHGEPLTGHKGYVYTVACTQVDGVPVAVTGGDDHTVRVWDLDPRRMLGHPLAGHTGAVRTVACTQVDGAPVVVSGGDDGTVQVRDLSTGQPRGLPITGREVNMAECTQIDGSPVVVTACGDSDVRVWDLRSGQARGEPLEGHLGPVYVVACTEVDGVPVAVTGDAEKNLLKWNLRTRLQTTMPPNREIRRARFRAYAAAACTKFDNVPIAVTSVSGEMKIWDLRTCEPFGSRFEGSGFRGIGVRAIACTDLNGVPVAVTGDGDSDDDGAVRVWDLHTRRPIGEPLRGHARLPIAVACAKLDNPMAVTTDGVDVRLWNLLTREVMAVINCPRPRAVTITTAGDLVIGFHNDVALYRRQLGSGPIT